MTRNKNSRTLRQIIAQRKFSQAINKKELTNKKKTLPFQKSFRNFMDITIGKSPRKGSELPLESLKHATTIHESLEHFENGELNVSNEEHDRPKSNIELRHIFNEFPPKEKLGRQESFEYGYAENKLETASEKPVVIIGKLSVEDCAEVQSVDAIILPEVRNVYTTGLEKCNLERIVPSVSLPDIAENQCCVEKSLNNRISIKPNISETLTPPAKSFDNSYERLNKDSILLYLLEQKANVNAKDLYGSTPLHYAAMRGNETAVSQLLSLKSIDVEVII